MGIQRPRWSASNRELAEAAAMARRAADILTSLARAAELLEVSLTEVSRYRGRVADAAAPLDWQRFVDETRAVDPDLASSLDCARPARFEFGNATLCAKSGYDYAMLSLKKEILTKTLSNRYGVAFRVRIRHQE